MKSREEEIMRRSFQLITGILNKHTDSGIERWISSTRDQFNTSSSTTEGGPVQNNKFPI